MIQDRIAKIEATLASARRPPCRPRAHGVAGLLAELKTEVSRLENAHDERGAEHRELADAALQVVAAEETAARRTR